MKSRIVFAMAALAAALGYTQAARADDCPNRGDLDTMYCDANKDLVADTPTDPAKLKTPSTIVFTYTPVEDPAVYAEIFAPFTKHLAQCMDRKVVFYQVQSNAAEIEAMRSNRLHVGGFSTGPTNFAVNLAGAVPFAVKGNADGFQGYNLFLIVKKDSPYQKLSDLKGKKWRTPRRRPTRAIWRPSRCFPTRLVPGKDYAFLYSGKHDQSIMGVNSGDYDAAAVASDVFHRMAERGQIKEEDFRVIYRSEKFPTSSFSYAYDLEPAFRDKMLKCFYDYRFPKEMKEAFDGADRFYPVTYQKDWKIVRDVAKAGGESFTRSAYDKAAAKGK